MLAQTVIPSSQSSLTTLPFIFKFQFCSHIFIYLNLNRHNIVFPMDFIIIWPLILFGLDINVIYWHKNKE